MAIDCVFLGGAEHDESCPYGSRPALLNRSMILRFLPLLLATFKENVYIYGEILYDCYALFFITMTPSASYRTQARVIQCSY